MLLKPLWRKQEFQTPLFVLASALSIVSLRKRVMNCRNNRMLSLWKRVKSWGNKMSSSFPVKRRKVLSDELIERRESLPDELTARSEPLPDELTARSEPLPDELIEEILSWLPVKSAVRFKTVCKLFHTIIQDEKFIEKHMQHAKVDTTIGWPVSPARPKAAVSIWSQTNGLVLERLNPSGIYQIRNHATNRIIELPKLEGTVISCTLCHTSRHRNEYKVLAVYWEGSGLGLKVLTVGTDIAWRPIKIPLSSDFPKNGVTSRTAVEGINYTVQFSKLDLKQSKMIAFKLEDETFMEISMPRPVLFSSKFWAVKWELTISFICRTEDGFRVWVLDDGKRSKWTEKKLVFQTHATSQDEVHSIFKIARPICVLEGLLYCKFGDQEKELVYDIKTERIVSKGPITPRRIQNLNTLVSFRGMH